MSSKLFTPIALRGVTLPNRIVIAPMCQYSADDGSPTDWHIQHLGTLTQSGAGLVVIEKTNVERTGRITHGCTGLYSDANEAAFARVLAGVRAYSKTPIGVQLGHAGRKASSARPWEGGGPLTPEQDPWQTVAPSAIPFDQGWHTPKALTEPEIDRLVESFAGAARRAARLGLDEVELHCAHGYLLNEFLSPLANKREDRYGGSLENRMRFPLRVAEAVRAAWPADKPLGARISATDWRDDGWTIEDSVVFVRALRDRGCDFVCASSGGIIGGLKIPLGPGYQVKLAARLKRDTGMAIRAVGLIVTPRHAESILAEGEADMIAMARAVLDDPRWGWHAAEALGATAAYAPQYERVRPTTWPGAKLRSGVA
jgi:2,4-dienoyl-CoA reductase-like NADH-dependent reductase (Old Yellow Enzyme family)